MTTITFTFAATPLPDGRSCDAIYLLRGWETSRGAKMELDEALKNGLKVILEEVSE